MDNKLKRSLADPKERNRRYGKEMAKKLSLRLDALEAADTLGDFWPPYSGPERCHELKGNLAGTYSMDVKQPYRLLFRPTEDLRVLVEPTPKDTEGKDTEGKDRWKSIRSIVLVRVEDTHG